MSAIDYDGMMREAENEKDPAKRARAFKAIQDLADQESGATSAGVSVAKYQDEMGLRSGARDMLTGLMTDKSSRVEPEEYRGVEGANLRQRQVQDLQAQKHTFTNEDLAKFYGNEQVTRKGMQPNTPEFDSTMVAGLTEMGMPPDKIAQYQKVYGAPEETAEQKNLKAMYPGMSLAKAHEAYKKAGKSTEDSAKDDITIRKGAADIARKQLKAKYGAEGVKWDIASEPVFPEGFNQEKYYEDFYNIEKNILKEYGKKPNYDYYHDRGKKFMESAKTDEEKVKKIRAMKEQGWSKEKVAKMVKELGWE
jgi:hypothetical protein